MLALALFVIARDPWLWPFDSKSIWNVPIGDGARYESIKLPRPSYCGVDEERFVRLASNDPVREIREPLDWAKRWPGGRKIGEMPVPDDLIIPDASPPSTPNACTTFLMPDGHTLIQLEPTCRVEPKGPIVGYPRRGEDLYGMGIYGTHWGSGLSSIGGSIRLGELTRKSAISHALKLNLWGKWLAFHGATPGYRWPADRAEAMAKSTYQGTNPKLVMGALLALAPELTSKSLGLTTQVGDKLFHALQDYGAYLSDDSGWNAVDLCAEIGVIEEVKAKTGLELSGGSGPLFEDEVRLIRALTIIENNCPSAIGGGGKRRRDLAPPILRD
ncbi:hypothetical protein BH11ARM1_BH11ARM1_13890 [soil metagenome]